MISPKILKNLERISLGDRFKKHEIRTVKVIDTLGKQSQSQKKQKGTGKLAQAGLDITAKGEHEWNYKQKDMYREAM